MNINATSTAAKDAAPIEMVIPSGATSKNSAAQSIQNQQTVAKTKEVQGKSLSSKEVKELAKEMNELMDDLHTSLGFSIREELNHQVVVEIKNRQTNELIKQIPSEDLLKIKEKMEEFTGLIFDHHV